MVAVHGEARTGISVGVPGDALRSIDRFQQRHAALAVPLAVVRKFGDDEGSNLAGLIAFRAFFSLFPLLLVLTTGLGYVLAGNAKLREEAVGSVLAQFPVIGEQLQTSTLEGSGIALAIGIVGSLWAGFGVVIATERALDRVWAIPFRNRRSFLASRLRALLLLAVLGSLTMISTIASGLVGGGASPLGPATGVLFSLLLNLLVFSAIFALLGSRRPTARELAPGVVAAAATWTVLQLVGGYFVAHEIRSASPAYGTFAIVLGLLVWLNLAATMFVLCAELNVVRAHRLWPRSLFGVQRREDERVLSALARSQARDDTQQISSEFDRRPQG